jgi:hypothetical protein
MTQEAFHEQDWRRIGNSPQERRIRFIKNRQQPGVMFDGTLENTVCCLVCLCPGLPVANRSTRGCREGLAA